MVNYYKSILLISFFLFHSIILAQSDSNAIFREEVLSIIENTRKPYHPDYVINKDLSDVEILDSIYEKVKNDTVWYFEIALSYLAIGEYDKSLEIYHILEENNFHSAASWYNMACAYSIKNDIEKSAFYIEKRLQVDDGLLSKDEYKWLLKDSDLINLRGSQEFKRLKGFYLSRKDRKAADYLDSALKAESNHKGARTSKFLNKIAKKYLKAAELENKSNYVNNVLINTALSSASALFIEDGNTEKSEEIKNELISMGSDLSSYYEMNIYSYQAINDSIKFLESLDSLVAITERKINSWEVAYGYEVAAEYYIEYDYEKAIYYKEKSFYENPSQIDFTDDYTVEWINYIINHKRSDFEGYYKFTDYLFEIGTIKNDYVNLLKLKAEDLFLMTWSDSTYSHKEMLSLLQEFEALPKDRFNDYDLLDLYAEVYYYMHYNTSGLIIENKALDLSKSKIKFPFYHYYFRYKKLLRIEDYDNALKLINKIFKMNTSGYKYYKNEVDFDFAQINVSLYNFEIAEKILKDMLPLMIEERNEHYLENIYDELSLIYMANNDSLMLRANEEKIIDFIETLDSINVESNFVREKNDQNLVHFENLALTHLVYDFEDYEKFSSIKYLEKGKYRYLKSKLNENPSVYYIPDEVTVDIFGLEQVWRADNYNNTYNDLNLNRIYYYFFDDDSLSIGMTSFSEEDSLYLSLHDLSTYSDSLYKSYSDLKYNTIKNEFSEASLLLNFINDLNHPKQFNEKIMFILDPILQFIPFEALIDSNGKYLIESLEISYTFSTTIQSILRKRNYNSNESRVLAFANPNIKPKKESSSLRGLVDDVLLNKGIERFNISNIHTSLGYKEWPKLLNAEKEALNIKEMKPSTKIFTGINASEAKLVELSNNGELKKYNIIHFATHAISIPEVQDASSIILSSGKDEEFDGYLTPSEISKLDLKADLVNLSACQTALGKTYDSEGISGFAQAFIEAGANGVLASLWNVNDESTAIFMTSFYSHYFKYRNVPKALALTKREFINGDYGDEYKKPFYWSPYVYYGI